MAYRIRTKRGVVIAETDVAVTGLTALVSHEERPVVMQKCRGVMTVRLRLAKRRQTVLGGFTLKNNNRDLVA